MRIVFLLTSLGVGGAEREALALAERMTARGHAVHVIVLRRLREEWRAELTAAHLDMRRTPWSALAGLLSVRRLLRELQPDLVHSHGFHANLMARLLRLLVPSTVLISTVHNVYEGGWLRMLAYRLTDSLSCHTTAVSEAVARRFIEIKAVSRRRCVVMPNAIEIADLRPDPARRLQFRQKMEAAGGFIWLAAGRIVLAKDYPNLLRAFGRVLAAMPQARLWIAGEGDLEAQVTLRALAAELGIHDRIRWLGLRRDMPALLDAADGFVSSSAWEGMPLAVAEAMAMEKTVVATDAGGVRELIGEAGVVVPARNAQALADAMLGVMREPLAARQAMGCAARKRIAAGFSMEPRADHWEGLYRTAIAEQG